MVGKRAVQLEVQRHELDGEPLEDRGDVYRHPVPASTATVSGRIPDTSTSDLR